VHCSVGSELASESSCTAGIATVALGNTWSHCVNTRLIVQYVDHVSRQVSTTFTGIHLPHRTPMFKISFFNSFFVWVAFDNFLLKEYMLITFTDIILLLQCRAPWWTVVVLMICHHCPWSLAFLQAEWIPVPSIDSLYISISPPQPSGMWASTRSLPTSGHSAVAATPQWPDDDSVYGFCLWSVHAICLTKRSRLSWIMLESW